MSDMIDGFGVQLQVSDGAASPSFTAIAGLTDVDGPTGMTRDSERSTTHDDTAGGHSFEALSNYDPGTVNITGFYDPTEATHVGSDGVVSLFTAGTTRDFKIVEPDSGSSEETFTAFFSELSLGSRPVDGLIPFTATLQISGSVTFPSA